MFSHLKLSTANADNSSGKQKGNKLLLETFSLDDLKSLTKRKSYRFYRNEMEKLSVQCTNPSLKSFAPDYLEKIIEDHKQIMEFKKIHSNNDNKHHDYKKRLKLLHPIQNDNLKKLIKEDVSKKVFLLTELKKKLSTYQRIGLNTSSFPSTSSLRKTCTSFNITPSLKVSTQENRSRKLMKQYTIQPRNPHNEKTKLGNLPKNKLTSTKNCLQSYSPQELLNRHFEKYPLRRGTYYKAQTVDNEITMLLSLLSSGTQHPINEEILALFQKRHKKFRKSSLFSSEILSEPIRDWYCYLNIVYRTEQGVSEIDIAKKNAMSQFNSSCHQLKLKISQGNLV